MIKHRRLKWEGHAARVGEIRNTFKMLTGKPTGNIPLGRSKHRWENNIRKDVIEISINTRNL